MSDAPPAKKAKVAVQATLGAGLALSKPPPEPRRSPRLEKRKGGPSADDLQAVAPQGGGPRGYRATHINMINFPLSSARLFEKVVSC